MDQDEYREDNDSGFAGPDSAPVNTRDLFNAIETDNYKEFKTRFDELAERVPAQALANSINPDGVSLLHSAATYDRYEIASFLMFSGAAPDARTSKGFTPLYMATYHNPNSFKMVSLLIRNGCDINAKSNYGHFPLYNAIEERNSEVARLLMENGADVSAVVTEDGGETALHVAAKYDDDFIALELIRRGADINAKNDEKRTPMFLAALNNSEKVMKLLVDHHAGTDITAPSNAFALDAAEEDAIKELPGEGGQPYLTLPDNGDGSVEAPGEKEAGPEHRTRESFAVQTVAEVEPEAPEKRRPIFIAAAVSIAVVLGVFFLFSQGRKPSPGAAVEPVIVTKAIAYDAVAASAPVKDPEAAAATLEPFKEAGPVMNPAPGKKSPAPDTNLEPGKETTTSATSPDAGKPLVESTMTPSPGKETLASAMNPEPEHQTPDPVMPAKTPHHLIVGSFKEPANATRFMIQIKQLGFSDCTTMPRDQMTLVSLESFAKIHEAEARKQEIFKDHKLESWIFTQK